MRDVTDRLHAKAIDPHELVHFLMFTFHQGTCSALDRIDIPEPKAPKLQIYFTPSGQIMQIDTSLTDKELAPVIANLEELFLSPKHHQVRRFISFAHAPIAGTWECQAFTITAAPPEAPRPQGFSTGHPYILEVPFEATGDNFFDIYRAGRLVARYELLLSLFAIGFKATRNNLNVIWGRYMDAPDYGEPLPHMVQEFYTIPGHQLIAEHRTPLAEPLIKLVPDGEYFGRRIRMPPDHDLDLPQSLAVWINLAVSCDERLRKQLLRAACWLCHAHEVYALSQSAALVAAVQAVETLLPVVKGEACPTCKREISPGPTRKFKDFLQEYAPTTSAEERKARDRLYRQRSQLTHGHELLVSDSDYLAGLTNPAHAFDSQTLDRALQLAPLCAINWFVGKVRAAMQADNT